MCDRDVKRNNTSRWVRLAIWVDQHPRTGWYFTALLVFNTIVNVIELF